MIILQLLIEASNWCGRGVYKIQKLACLRPKFFYVYTFMYLPLHSCDNLKENFGQNKRGD